MDLLEEIKVKRVDMITYVIDILGLIFLLILSVATDGLPKGAIIAYLAFAGAIWSINIFVKKCCYRRGPEDES